MLSSQSVQLAIGVYTRKGPEGGGIGKICTYSYFEEEVKPILT